MFRSWTAELVHLLDSKWLTTNIFTLKKPGDTKSVNLVSIGDNKVIRGGNGIADGQVNETNLREAMEAVCNRGIWT